MRMIRMTTNNSNTKMKEVNIQKGIDQIKKVSLSQDEKSKMLHNLSLYADVHQPIPSTHSLFSFFNISVNRNLAYALVSIMIAVTSGGTIVFASENSLPGDLLYPIKTKVVEPIKMAMAITPEAKAEVQTELADNRLKEAETLDNEGRLTPKLNKEIAKQLESHISGFYKLKNQIEKNVEPTLRSVPDATSTDENNIIQKNFDTKMRPHAEILNKFDGNIRGFYNSDVSSEKGIGSFINPNENINNPNKPDKINSNTNIKRFLNKINSEN